MTRSGERPVAAGPRYIAPRRHVPRQPVLALRALAVGHGKRAFVSGIDLEVRPGELVALIGPNGSGKTTILRTIAGHLSPVAGTIELDGRDVRTLPASERARHVAALFTARARTELLTCQDIVEAGRYPFTGRLGVLGGEDRERVRAVMEAAGVWHLRDRDFSHISDGQRQRTLIARALAQEPRLLILDEPTSYLDIRSQIDMLELLRAEARTRGCAILTSLHEIALAQKAADRVVCVRDGRVQRIGAPDEVMDAAAIEALYGLDEGAYTSEFGSIELARREGAPEVFVIAGAGSGATAMRTLQREGVPFAAGVLFEHDSDGVLARSLAAACVLAPDFEPISPADAARARKLLLSARALVVCPAAFHTLDAANAELVGAAHDAGIPTFTDATACLGYLHGTSDRALA